MIDFSLYSKKLGNYKVVPNIFGAISLILR